MKKILLLLFFTNITISFGASKEFPNFSKLTKSFRFQCIPGEKRCVFKRRDTPICVPVDRLNQDVVYNAADEILSEPHNFDKTPIFSIKERFNFRHLRVKTKIAVACISKIVRNKRFQKAVMEHFSSSEYGNSIMKLSAKVSDQEKEDLENLQENNLLQLKRFFHNADKKICNRKRINFEGVGMKQCQNAKVFKDNKNTISLNDYKRYRTPAQFAGTIIHEMLHLCGFEHLAEERAGGGMKKGYKRIDLAYQMGNVLQRLADHAFKTGYCKGLK